MVIDVHVHVSACTPEHGVMSPRVVKSLPFRFMRWRLGMPSQENAATERAIERKLADTIEDTPQLDAAVILAFDAVYRDGQLDRERTHLWVTNDYVIELVQRHPKMRFGASIHPYRPDAVQELERCVKSGAVLLKWLPIVQDFNPADERCFPLYEAMAHHRLPLLCHTGGEKTLPCHDLSVADPMLLVPALQRGVTVIAAHCGTRSAPSEPDYVPQFMQLAREHEHFYGDTSALNLPTRSYAYKSILTDPLVRLKLVHGSDWPVIALPPLKQLGLRKSLGLMRDRNWMRRDIRIKEQLDFDDAYWRRAARVLRLGA